MGVWKEVKKALNSTLGTANFKPLNILLGDRVTTAETNIRQDILGYYYVASNTVISQKNVNYSTSATNGTGTAGTLIGTIIFANSGTVRVRISGKNNNANNENNISTWLAYEDGTRASESFSSSMSRGGTGTASGDVEVEKGTVYKVYGYLGREGSISIYEICGTKTPFYELTWK